MFGLKKKIKFKADFLINETLNVSYFFHRDLCLMAHYIFPNFYSIWRNGAGIHKENRNIHTYSKFDLCIEIFVSSSEKLF